MAQPFFRTDKAQAIAKLLADPFWRLTHLYFIKPKSGPIELFKPTKEQIELFYCYWWRNAILKARQLGFSTLIDLLIGDKCIFNPNFTASIVDHTLDDAKRKLGIIKRQWDMLDSDESPWTSTVGKLIKSRLKLKTDSKTLLEWSNGSSVYAATSVRGGTLQALHISELGRTAARFADRAEEIMSGGIPAVGQDCLIFSESTHEGGPFGVHATLVKNAMKMVGKKHSALDFKFHWFPWQDSDEYQLDDGEIETDLVEYFTERLPQAGIHLNEKQQRFYSAQYRTLKHRVRTEYPSTPEEALAAMNAGSIYGDIMSRLRLKGRITDFEHDDRFPIFAFWDIGVSDHTSIWFLQVVGQSINVLRWIEDSGKPVSFYVGKIRRLEDELMPIAWHYLPHDADIRDKASAMTYRQALAAAGIKNAETVPRTPDVWVGINAVRSVLPHCWFHVSCEKTRVVDGVDYPSGVTCLEMYHRDVDIEAGKLKEFPEHDFTSHTCDAFRTFGEAWARGLVQARLKGDAKPKKSVSIAPSAIMGFASDSAATDDGDFSIFDS